MNIRHRVDAYDEQCLFGNESSGPSTDAPVSRSHVRLGSLDNIIHLSSYAKKLSKDIHLEDLQSLLTTFFRLNRVFCADLEGGTISGLKVGIILCTSPGGGFTLVQVVPCHALQVTYDCQETAMKKTDLLRVTPSWRGSGERYDCAILQGAGSSGLVFCQVCALFMVSVARDWHRLAVVRIYEQRRRNKVTGHIELVAPKDGYFDLCFVESVVRVAHLLPPTEDTTRSTVQDLYDGDMYLRLHHIQ